MNKIKLYKPIKIDGKEVKELTADFDKLPCNANVRATSFLAQNRYGINNPLNDIELHNLFFGIASGLMLEDAFTLHIKDKMAAAMVSMTFFNTDSEDGSQKTTSEESK